MKHVAVDEIIRFVSLTTLNREASTLVSAVAEKQKPIESVTENTAVHAQDPSDPACAVQDLLNEKQLIDNVNGHLRSCDQCRKLYRRIQTLLDECVQQLLYQKPYEYANSSAGVYEEIIKKELAKRNLTEEKQGTGTIRLTELTEKMLKELESDMSENLNTPEELFLLTDEQLDAIPLDECAEAEDFSDYLSECGLFEEEDSEECLLDKYFSEYVQAEEKRKNSLSENIISVNKSPKNNYNKIYRAAAPIAFENEKQSEADRQSMCIQEDEEHSSETDL